MIFKNYYKILGLQQNTKSTQDEIKNAYRAQAKKYHPDVNVNNKNAEERFKDINEAYRILSDPIQKRKYDRSWNNYIGKKMQKEKMSEKEVKVNDIMNMFFGSNIKAKKELYKEPIRGENIETQIDISVKEAFEGIEKRVSIMEINGETIDIKITSGIKNGEILRFEGKGKKGKNGGKNGDLLIKINIVNNSNFKLVKNDIYVNLYIAPWDAALGAKMKVKGVDGEVSILIPKGTQNGDKISIPNKGYYEDNNKRGNLVVKARVVIPKKLTEEEKELFTKLKEISKFNAKNVVNIK